MWSCNSMLLLKLVCLFALCATVWSRNKMGVEYDGRSLIINGKRELVFSGSVHYPRSTPEMWPRIIARAKEGGLNCIQTYVFWNGHEPVQGEYNFKGRYDLVQFIKLVAKQDMYVTLRIGPFIQAEWNYGGFPYWLREVKNITFRTNNEPYKQHMEKFVRKIVSLMKEERLFASQGGPIILAQIENEYNTIQRAFKDNGTSYVQWAGNMALKLDIGIPWLMCKQKDAPGPVINACNGRNCGDTFAGPNAPNKPIIWTENWTQQYRVFGDPPSLRSVEDIAYSIVRFFSKNGTLSNYYMYHGGTNFGRTAASFVTTRYYDEAPLDEFGFPKEPKYSHLRDVHQAVKLCRKALLWGTSTIQTISKTQEVIIHELRESKICCAFISNSDKRKNATITFRGTQYFLPSHSVSVLPDCKNVALNTRQVISQHNLRTFEFAPESHKNLEWKTYQEKIPDFRDSTFKYNGALEHLNLTKDSTDYVWYSTDLDLDEDDLPWREDTSPVLQVHSLGHAMHGFVNGKYIGTGHGDRIEKSFTFKRQVPLKAGKNCIALLSMTMGLPDSGVYLERRLLGLHFMAIQGLNTGTLDITDNWWGYKIGTDGEKLRLYTEEGAKKVQWSNAKGSDGKQLIWYKAYFDAPKGENPVAIDVSSMSKGHIWVNEEHIGRYWVSFLSPLKQPSQTEYHIPRCFLKPKGNFLVVFEEIGGNPDKIKFTTVNRDTVCSYVTQFFSPHVDSWARKNNEILMVADRLKPHIHLTCPEGKVVARVEFASYGNPDGVCGRYNAGSCNYPESKSVVEKYCLGENKCEIPVMPEAFGGDKCPKVDKTLATQVKCEFQKSNA